MKKLIMSCVLGLTVASNFALAEDRVSGGLGLSINGGQVRMEDQIITTVNPVLPNVDGEMNVNLSKDSVQLKLQGSAGLQVGDRASRMTLDLTPIISFKVADDLRLGAGVKFKNSYINNRPEGEDNRTSITANKAIYAEARTTVGKNNNELYVGVSKNFEDKGYDLKLGWMHTFGEKKAIAQ